MPRSKIKRPKTPPAFPSKFQLPKTLHSAAHDQFIRLMRKAREEADLTQIEVSKILGVRQSYISDVERGERRLDVIEFLYFCRAYRINPARILSKLTADI